MKIRHPMAVKAVGTVAACFVRLWVGLVNFRCRYRDPAVNPRKRGPRALRQMARNIQSGAARHIAVTPDGPRGPRRTVQPGLVYLAGLTGLPIVPVGFAYRGAWRMNSWD